MFKATSAVKPTLSTKIKLSSKNCPLKLFTSGIWCCAAGCLATEFSKNVVTQPPGFSSPILTVVWRTSSSTFIYQRNWKQQLPRHLPMKHQIYRTTMHHAQEDVSVLPWHKTQCFLIGYVWHGPPCITVYSITYCWVGCGMTHLVQKSMYCFAVEAVVAAAPTTSVFLTPRHGPTEGASCEINPFWSDRQFLRVQSEEIHGSIILYFPVPSIVMIRQHLHG
jgi:hypothetical protein